MRRVREACADWKLTVDSALSAFFKITVASHIWSDACEVPNNSPAADVARSLEGFERSCVGASKLVRSGSAGGKRSSSKVERSARALSVLRSSIERMKDELYDSSVANQELAEQLVGDGIAPIDWNIVFAKAMQNVAAVEMIRFVHARDGSEPRDWSKEHGIEISIDSFGAWGVCFT